jgi:hypothetical protein
MKIDWKRISVEVGNFRVRLKTMIAAVLVGAAGVLMDPALQYIDLQPIISALVGEERKALFYGTLVSIVFAVLRAMTNGPFVERITREEEQ